MQPGRLVLYTKSVGQAKKSAMSPFMNHGKQPKIMSLLKLALKHTRHPMAKIQMYLVFGILVPTQ